MELLPDQMAVSIGYYLENRLNHPEVFFPKASSELPSSTDSLYSSLPVEGMVESVLPRMVSTTDFGAPLVSCGTAVDPEPCEISNASFSQLLPGPKLAFKRRSWQEALSSPPMLAIPSVTAGVPEKTELSIPIEHTHPLRHIQAITDPKLGTSIFPSTLHNPLGGSFVNGRHQAVPIFDNENLQSCSEFFGQESTKFHASFLVEHAKTPKDGTYEPSAHVGDEAVNMQLFIPMEGSTNHFTYGAPVEIVHSQTWLEDATGHPGQAENSVFTDFSGSSSARKCTVLDGNNVRQAHPEGSSRAIQIPYPCHSQMWPRGSLNTDSRAEDLPHVQGTTHVIQVDRSKNVGFHFDDCPSENVSCASMLTMSEAASRKRTHLETNAAQSTTMSKRAHLGHISENNQHINNRKSTAGLPSSLSCSAVSTKSASGSSRSGKSDSSRNAHRPALNTTLKPRARQGTGNDPQTIASRNRRERINARLKILQELVPNGSKVDLVTMLEKAINYVKFLQLQLRVLGNDDYWLANQDKALHELKSEEDDSQATVCDSVGPQTHDKMCNTMLDYDPKDMIIQ